MSQYVTTAFKQTFQDQVDLLLQQKGSKLRNAVRVESITGEKTFFDRIGGLGFAERRTTRHQTTRLTDTPHDRRMVLSYRYEHADMIDDPDALRTGKDFKPAYAQNMAYSFGRTMDRDIVNAAFATAYSGADGTTAVTFPSAQQVGVNDHTYDTGTGNVGLTVGKIKSAHEKLVSAPNGTDEEWYIALNGKQHAQLLTEAQAINMDYRARPVLEEGFIQRFMNFNFIILHDSILPKDSNGYRRVLAWTKSGLLLAIGKDMMTRVDERPDMNYDTQIWMAMDIGAVRMEETKVVEIKCYEP